MTAKPAQRPPWILLTIGLFLLAIGVARVAQPHEWYDPGDFLVVAGAHCIGRYVDRALRWLKERP